MCNVVISTAYMGFHAFNVCYAHSIEINVLPQELV